MDLSIGPFVDVSAHSGDNWYEWEKWITQYNRAVDFAAYTSREKDKAVTLLQGEMHRPCIPYSMIQATQIKLHF